MLIPLDKKKMENEHLFGRNKVAKIGETFSKDGFLIILLHWPSFYFSKTDTAIYKKNYIGKGEKDNLSLGIGTINKYRRTNNQSININIADKHKKNGQSKQSHKYSRYK